jgi:hypothetical protein
VLLLDPSLRLKPDLILGYLRRGRSRAPQNVPAFDFLQPVPAGLLRILTALLVHYLRGYLPITLLSFVSAWPLVHFPPVHCEGSGGAVNKKRGNRLKAAPGAIPDVGSAKPEGRACRSGSTVRVIWER